MKANLGNIMKRCNAFLSMLVLVVGQVVGANEHSQCEPSRWGADDEIGEPGVAEDFPFPADLPPVAGPSQVHDRREIRGVGEEAHTENLQLLDLVGD